MKTRTKTDQRSRIGKDWLFNLNTTDSRLQVTLKDRIRDDRINDLLQEVHDAIKLYHIKALLIHDQNIDDTPMELNWKIIETSWKEIHQNGGRKITIDYEDDVPNYIESTYSEAIKKYGLPIELEFGSTG
jgi:hypothetical protein